MLVFLLATLQTFAQTYTYDSNNRLTKVVYDNGTTITYNYDALGNRMSKKVIGSVAEKYTISVTVTPTGSGTVIGGGTYAKGTTIELNAIPNAGYKFSKWSNGSTDNPLTISVSGNQNYTAQFVESSSELLGDVVPDGVINQQDLNALVNAYASGTMVTKATDIDTDNQLTIADITKLISMLPQQGGDDNANTYNGHEYVDLGLPSGALWATCNVGASAPEETGSLFAWGETEPKETYTWETYKFTNGSKPTSSNASITKYGVTGCYGVVDNKVTLDAADDVAVDSWGGEWHMPTNEDFQDLIDNTTQQWTKLNNVKGYLFTGTNGNTMFIPEGNNGCWSSSLRASGGHGTNADQLDYNTTNIGVSGGLRYKGYPVRPILSERPSSSQTTVPTSYMNHEYVDLGLPSGTLWATCNVGAISPEAYGCYYSWGETSGSCDGKTIFNYENYKYNNSNLNDNFTKYCCDADYGYNGFTDYLTELEAVDDVATAKWGGMWHMPTRTQTGELGNKNYTSWEWTSINGIAGWRVTSIIEGYKDRSIFLPAAGMFNGKSIVEAGEYGEYWTSSLYSQYSEYSKSVYFKSTSHGHSQRDRDKGLTVRPVVSKSAVNQ